MHVSDQGVGIPPEHLGRIFDPFFTTKTGGSGLGLAVTHSVIHKHEGLLDVRSVPGAGTTFVFRIPALPEEAEPADRAPTPPRERKAGRVLIMDDNADLREVIALMAQELGYEPVVAVDGAGAVQAVRDAIGAGQAFAVAILDLTVPGGMGGIEAAARIREVAPALPLVISSGYSATGAAASPHEHGFAAAITKPYTLARLRRVLDEVVG